MRIRPGGAELLQTARAVIDTTILPHVAEDCRDAVRAIEPALVIAEDRLTQDLEASASDLATLDDARVAMRGEILQALPEARRYDARLVAKAISVATRQLANGSAPERREYERLCALFGIPAAVHASPDAVRCALFSLNERLCAHIRAGDADVGTATHAASFAHLEASTHEALSESNPAFGHRAATSAPSAPAAAGSAQAFAPVAAAFAAWSDVPWAFLRALPLSISPAPLTQRVVALERLRGTVGEAVCASSNAAFTTQADLFGWFTQRLAANPRVPMVAVEGAHQAHDLFVSIADASAAFLHVALVPFHRVEPHPAEVTSP